MHTLTLDQLRKFFVAGEVTAVTLRADGTEFEIHVGTPAGMCALAGGSLNGSDRFSEPRDALLLMMSIGIHNVRVDSSGWMPDTTQGSDDAVHRKIRASLAGHRDGGNPSYSPDEWEQLRARKKARRDAL